MNAPKSVRRLMGKCLQFGLIAITAAACVGPSVVGPRNSHELESRYLARWPGKFLGVKDFNGELFQLAFPTETSVSVWHLYAKVATTRLPLNQFGIRKKISTTDPGEPPSNLNIVPIRRYVAGTKQVDDALQVNIPKAERIDFSGLTPDTEYEILHQGRPILVAKTKPATTPDAFSFLAFSCNNPYGENWAFNSNSLQLFSARSNDVMKIEGYPRPAFGIGLGDQVYVDGDNNPDKKPSSNDVAIFRGERSQPTFEVGESFDSLLDIVYRAHFAMPAFHRGLQGIPTALIWDDHELQDGWGTRANRIKSLGYGDYFDAALTAFLGFQGLRNPNPPRKPVELGESMDVDFDWGTMVHVLLLDTRSTGLPGDGVAPSSIPKQWDKQKELLARWLKRADEDSPQLFVLGVSSPLSIASSSQARGWMQDFKRRSKLIATELGAKESIDDLEDLWVMKEYARKSVFEILLRHFKTHSNHRLLILSGDVHFSGVNYLSMGPHSAHRPAGVERSEMCQSRVPKTVKISGRDTPVGSEFAQDVKGHAVWGWEVISSGITNNKFPNLIERLLMRQGTLRDSAGNPMLTAWSRGSVFGSPSFAEIFVKKTDTAPQIRVAFYPSSSGATKELINPASAFEQRSTPWPTVDYDFVVGSMTSPACPDACPMENTSGRITTVPLDWNCVPPSPPEAGTYPNNGKVYNCVHACSSALKPANYSEFTAQTALDPELMVLP